MNIFSDIQNALDQGKSQFTTIKNTLIPIEIQNLKKTGEALDKSIAQIEQQTLAADNPQALTQITHLRTSLMTHFGHLVRGGDPEPVVGGKNHPVYVEAKNKYADLDSRLSVLEQKYQGCTFGYQLIDGQQIMKPTLDWSEEKWMEIKNSARDQVARCWLDTDKNQYR